MKTRKALISLLLITALAFSLGAAGGAAAYADGNTDPAEAAQTYSYLCSRMSASYLVAAAGYGGETQPVRDHYVTTDGEKYDDYTVTLNADGTGYLFLGENNQGPIDSWTLEGSQLRFQAGVSEFNAMLSGGLMTVEFDKGLYLVFAAPGADLSDVRPISVDAFIDLILGVVEGRYTLFAAREAGAIEVPGPGEAYELTLEEGGTGSINLSGVVSEIASWSIEGNSLRIMLAGDSKVLSAAIRRDLGIIRLEIPDSEDFVFYYGREGAPATILYALYDGIDPAAGAHLKYALHTDYMDSTSVYDTHTKDGIFYSADTIQVKEYESRTATFFKDGKAYSLNPDMMTGMLATTTTSSIITGNPLRMDSLYSAIETHALEADCHTETKDENGGMLTVVSYPASGYEPEASSWFDGEGKLVRYEEGAPVIDIGFEIGESVYTVESIDTAVDESLFDISGYQITE